MTKRMLVPALSAADMVRGADAVRRDLAREGWPYDFIYPPPGSRGVHGCSPGSTPGGAIGLQATAVPNAPGIVAIGCLQVPSGMRFVMSEILLAYDQAFNPGDTLWTVFCNPGGGAQANPVQGLINEPVPLGSWKYGTRVRFPRAYEFAQLDIIQAQAQNVNLVAGASNFYVTGFMGWFVPESTSR